MSDRPIHALANVAELKQENQRLRKALRECADELEAEIEDRYGHGIKEHPAMRRRYERDMETVRAARATLGDTHEP